MSGSAQRVVDIVRYKKALPWRVAAQWMQQLEEGFDKSAPDRSLRL